MEKLTHTTAIPWREALASAYNWGLWMLIAVLVGSQFLGIVWNSSSSHTDVFFGEDPRRGPAPLSGFNDELYSDRTIICMSEGRGYAPIQLNTALSNPQRVRTVDRNGTTVNAIRVVKREGMQLSPTVIDDYSRKCDRVDATLAAIQSSCEALGFSVTRDVLRVVDGVTSDTTLAIDRALPILINPFWDNAVHVHYVIPSEDGAACMFELDGSFQLASSDAALLRGVPRSIRTTTTEEWLQRPGGKWRNGWYEDTQGQRWVSNMQTTQPGNVYGIVSRLFDLKGNVELNCSATPVPSLCRSVKVVSKWGSQFTTSLRNFDINQVAISNSTRYGLFLYSSTTEITVTISYSLENFISNMSVFAIVFRWFVSMATMLHSYRCKAAPFQTTGIGCLSSSRTFNLVPIMLLPRLRSTLASFFSVGCYFEGQQSALSEAWFAMYPGLVELMFYLYSLINIVGKITRRRVSDALFGPTLLFFCALHYWRREVSQSTLFDTNGRMTTLMLSDEVDALGVVDFFSSDAALRLNGGNIRLLTFKLVVLALSCVPLLFSEKMTTNAGKWQAFATCKIEQTLAIRACQIGGLGLSPLYIPQTSEGRSSQSIVASLKPTAALLRPSHKSSKTVAVAPHADDVQPMGRSRGHVLTSYEINRLGYLVFGGKYLLSYDDWYILTSMAPLRAVEKLWNYRINVYEVSSTGRGVYEACERPRVCRLDDPDLQAIRFYDITLSAFE